MPCIEVKISCFFHLSGNVFVFGYESYYVHDVLYCTWSRYSISCLNYAFFLLSTGKKAVLWVAKKGSTSNLRKTLHCEILLTMFKVNHLWCWEKMNIDPGMWGWLLSMLLHSARQNESNQMGCRSAVLTCSTRRWHFHSKIRLWCSGPHIVGAPVFRGHTPPSATF